MTTCDLLDLLRSTRHPIPPYTTYALDLADPKGHIDVLGWWKLSAFELRWRVLAIWNASEYGQVEALEWWRRSELEIKWSKKAMHMASSKGMIQVLEWWKNSGLEMQWTED
ncbi:hypothetical protein BJ742DRAFT_759440, partial [Cladochytrium replicatum]